MVGCDGVAGVDVVKVPRLSVTVTTSCLDARAMPPSATGQKVPDGRRVARGAGHPDGGLLHRDDGALHPTKAPSGDGAGSHAGRCRDQVP